jgi:peptidoglycan/LPS O-acetylase OafA/YrhL
VGDLEGRRDPDPDDTGRAENGRCALTVAVPPRPLRRLAFLDAVRGLAALAVFGQHAVELVSPAFVRWCHEYINFGDFGVVAFFLVSGMIIPLSLERYGSIKRFWLGRFWRLYPLYWLNLGLLLVFGFAGRIELPPQFHEHPWITSLANVTMLQEFFGFAHANWAYWTLSLEMVFYVLCSALFLRGWLNRSVINCLVLAGGLLVIDILADVLLHRSIPVGHVALLLTAFLGTVVYRTLDGKVSRSAMLAVIGIVVVIITHGLWMRFATHPTAKQESFATPGSALTSWALAYAMFFFFFAVRHRPLPAPLLWLGKITYSLYLMHGLVIHLVPRTMPVPVWLACVSVLTLAIASLTYRWVERPLMKRAEAG